MATVPETTATNAGTTTGIEKGTNGDHAAAHGRRPYDYGGNPLAHIATNNPDLRLTAFGGEFQPGLYRQPKKGIANPAPLGLSAFALTTFVLSLNNMNTRHMLGANSLVLAIAYGYGGLVQLLAGMWEMAVGNTFGATALSSYGGFWISFGIILTPGFDIATSLTGPELLNSLGFYLMGWFIFTFVLLMCTLRSTVMFFLLFFTLDMAFLLLGIGYLVTVDGAPKESCIKAGGAFGILAAFLAWYNAFAGIADSSNSFFIIPVIHFPWSEKGRERREKVDNAAARAEQSV